MLVIQFVALVVGQQGFLNIMLVIQFVALVVGQQGFLNIMLVIYSEHHVSDIVCASMVL